MNELLPVLVITGTTSSGKTRLGIDLAKRYGGEVINADARQIYRDGCIGTGVPEGEWIKTDHGEGYHVEGVPHHLMAYASADEVLSVAAWIRQADQVIREVIARGQLPIIVGGTGLWIRALTEGFVFDGEIDPAIRERVLALSAEERLALLQAYPNHELVDAKNPHRVLRALEKGLAGQSLVPQRRPSPYTCLKIARAWSSEEAYARLCQDVEERFARGWMEEVRSLVERGVSSASPLLTSIGFPALVQAIASGEGETLLLRERVIADTWQYIRRQRTWFRKEPRLQWAVTPEEAVDAVERWRQSVVP
jgi:tRNA dimethylallyltransferase